MLQYPTNFYPENVAIDTTKENDIKFTFNGDFLTSVTYRVVDYITGEYQDSFTMGENNLPRWYNGDSVVVRGLSDLTNGNDYTIEMLLTQTDNSGNLLYDMSVLSGSVHSVSDDNSSSIFVDKHISKIYEWDKAEEVKTPTKYNNIVVAGMIIQINNESRFVESYNIKTGEIVLDSPFSFSVASGMRYIIKSNYLISAQYFFKCRSTPIITPSLNIYQNLYHHDFEAKADYSQAENSMISYYRLYLYSSIGEGSALAHEDILLSETEKIYSQKIEYYFDHVIQVEHRNKTTMDYYKLVCEIVTQDGMSVKSEYILSVPFANIDLDIADLSTIYDKTNNFLCLNLRSSSNEAYIRVTRKNIDTGEVLYVGTIGGSPETIRSIYDYSLPCRGNYVYQIAGILENGSVCNNPIEIPFSPTAIGYTITEILRSGGNRYYIGDTWRFTTDIQNTTVTQNINRYLHVGYGQYPTTSSTDINYMSGTLSGMIGYMNCTTKEYVDDITLVRQWREFITRPSMFMLKSQKGDVWFVNITDNPTTEYQEDYHKIPTTFSFNWVEVAKNIVLEQEQLYVKKR